ncbi:MAG: hypothetical protein C0625_12965 [Arcobacter sp.]|nr:MAG: hypothetical protein C0625_12965 [Arcobacter sp.]
MKNQNITINSSRRKLVITSSIVTASAILLPYSLQACDSGDFGKTARSIISSAFKGGSSALIASTIIASNPISGVILGAIAVGVAVSAISDGNDAVNEIGKLYTCVESELNNAINKL